MNRSSHAVAPRPRPWTGIRALLRLAIRDARRDRWRSLLVLVVVVLPVAGIVAAIALADSTTPTAHDNAVAQMGRADAVLWPLQGTWEEPDEVTGNLPVLPDDARVEVVWTAPGSIVAGGLERPLQLTDGGLGEDTLAAGRLELIAGRAPQVPDAVALSTELMARAELAVGDRIHLDPLGDLVVVGEVRDPELLSRSVGVVGPDRLEAVADASPEVLLGFPGEQVPDLAPVVAFGVPDGDLTDFSGRTREQLLEQRFGRSGRWAAVVVGGLAGIEVALVAGAAFAVSVRRRQRELGLLAATGATARHVRRSVLLTGVTIGAVGALVGLVVGVLVGQLLLPWAAGLADRAVDGLRLEPVLLGPASVLGGLAAVIGAWWPARNASRLPVLTALSGRRPTPAPAHRGLVVGLLLTVAGAAVCALAADARLGAGTPFVFLVGSVAVVLGAGLTSPWLLEQLGRTAGFLPTGPRLAVRDAARFRSRNGPIVTAAMAALAASVTITGVLGSLDAWERSQYEPPLPPQLSILEADGRDAAAADVASAAGLTALPMALPADAAVAASGEADPTAIEWVDAVVDDGALAAVLAEGRAADLLAEGRAVGLRPSAPSTVELRALTAGGELGEVTASFEVVSVEGTYGDGYWRIPQVLLPAAAVEEVASGSPHLLVGDGPIDERSLEAATAAAAAIGEMVHLTAGHTYRSGFGPVNVGVTVAGGIGGLAIVAVAIALAAAESRGDLRTLAAVGAGARTRRSLAAGRALLLAGLGGLLAVPVGLIPAAALTTVIDGGIPLVVPWSTIAVVTVGVPLLACLGSVAAGRRDPGALPRVA